jgi:hypothetical protein
MQDQKNPWPESASELYRPSDRRLSAKLVPTFPDRVVLHSQRDESLRLYYRLSRPEPLLFHPISSSIVLTILSGPRSRTTTSQKIWYCRGSNLDLWICSQELWPLDHRGGLVLFPRNIILLLLVLISVRGWVNPMTKCSRKDQVNWKNLSQLIRFRTRFLMACSIVP